MQADGKRGEKLHMFGSCYMTKMTAWPVYGKKKLYKPSPPEPLGRLPCNLERSIWGSHMSYDPGLILGYIMTWSDLIPKAFEC